jgi:2',3'-cyclic-nucleotide 2'-phosphodiesterase (5'-nucleotidase family)
MSILHFNDVHAHYIPFSDASCSGKVGGFGRLGAALEKAKKERVEQGREIYILFAGDLLTGTIYSNKFKGALGVDLLNKMDLQAMVVGNHEFDYGFKNLIDHMKPKMDFPLLSANIFSADQKPLFQGKIEKPLGKGASKLVILGLTTDYTPRMSAAENVRGLVFKDPIKTAQSELEEYSEKDLIIALTHLGIEYDRKLAAACPKIDIIVGGHSHTAIIQPQNMGKTLIVQAKAYTKYLGILDIDAENGDILNYEAQLKPLNPELPQDENLEKIIASYSKKLPKDLDKVIGRTEILLDAKAQAVRTDHNSVFGELITGMMARKTNADAGLINGGAIRKSVCPGPVTMMDLQEALPYKNRIMMIKIKGEDLLSAMKKSAALDYGSGGKLQRYGIHVALENGSVSILEIGGKPFDKDTVYRVAINDFILFGGDGYDIFKEKALDIEKTDMEVRSSLAGYIGTNGPVNMDLINNPR